MIMLDYASGGVLMILSMNRKLIGVIVTALGLGCRFVQVQMPKSSLANLSTAPLASTPFQVRHLTLRSSQDLAVQPASRYQVETCL
jgi:hypothetical protein